MKNLNKLITESLHSTINDIINEDIDKQNKLCKKVMIDEGLWNGLQTMWKGAKAIGGQIMNAGAYAKQNVNFQNQLNKVKYANDVIQDMARDGVINNSTLTYWNQQLAKYTQYLENNINTAYNAGNDYRNTQAASYSDIQKAKGIPAQIIKLQRMLITAKNSGDTAKAIDCMKRIQALKQQQQQLIGRQQNKP